MARITGKIDTSDGWRRRLRAFARGAGSILEIMPGSAASTLYKTPAEDGPAADRRALEEDWAAIGADWRAVGGDLRAALDDLPQPADDADTQAPA